MPETQYIETELLIAQMNGNYSRVRELAQQMTRVERWELRRAMVNLTWVLLQMDEEAVTEERKVRGLE